MKDLVREVFIKIDQKNDKWYCLRKNKYMKEERLSKKVSLERCRKCADLVEPEKCSKLLQNKFLPAEIGIVTAKKETSKVGPVFCQPSTTGSSKDPLRNPLRHASAALGVDASRHQGASDPNLG